ncbi:MAG: fumarylacetoacetate hydrolase family protein [Bryobacterales bacterium]|nr:fumarylacetoacetate hydrolase family protein [Bryobacterales bacterium]
MKLCTFEVRTALGAVSRTGVVNGGDIIDINTATAWRLAEEGEPRPQIVADVLAPGNMLEFVQGWTTSLAHAAKTLAMELPATGLRGARLRYRADEVWLSAPLPNPASLRDFYAFEQHVKTGFAKRGELVPQEWYEMPVWYRGSHQNIYGPDATVPWPRFTEKFDYELELALVIGVAGSDVTEAEALRHVAGITVMNDFSARDVQRREMKVRLGPAKGKDFATALGPVLVTLDEIPDLYNLQMTARVNGEVWSEGSTRDLYWKFEQMIAFCTEGSRMEPGDVIGSGTVGTGCGLELDRWVRPGDVMELEIEKVGVLRNVVGTR